jgi:hypothetical protein
VESTWGAALLMARHDGGGALVPAAAARNLLVLAVGVGGLAGLMRRGVDPTEPALLTTAA